jgi:hypothetical protein
VNTSRLFIIIILVLGTIERGHIYFFYRPKVQIEEAHSLDDVRNLQMLLVPRPPELNTVLTNGGNDTGVKKDDLDEETEMKLLQPGTDAVPSPEKLDDKHKHYRTLLIGRKKLPDAGVGGKGHGRKQTFWATVTKVGDDLQELESGLGEKSYETKTRGTRHEEPVRFAARGAYAIVNNDPNVPSGRETHFGYCISHPDPLGEVQEELGIASASSFVLQVKNPLAPNTGPMMGAGGKGAKYPDHIMDAVFGRGSRGRENYGLRFAPCETMELLEYEKAQLLLIAAREGEEGLDESLGEGRGKGL